MYVFFLHVCGCYCILLLTEVGEPQDAPAGKIKVELSYTKKQQILSVMVQHVRDLVSHITG